MAPYGLHQTRTGTAAAALMSRYGPSYQPAPRSPDRTANAGTIGIWDFATAYGAPGYPVPVAPVQGVLMHNLVPGGQDAQNVTYPGPGYAGGAVTFGPGANNWSIRLCNTPLKIGLMLTVWFKSTRLTAASSSNNRIAAIGGLMNVVVTGDANGQSTILEVPISGGNQVLTNADAKSAFGDGALHQMSFALEDRGGGKYRLVVRLDRIVVYTGADATYGAAGSGDVTLGAPDAIGTIVGGFYRARLDDLTAAMLSPDEIVAADYEANIIRLTAASS